MPDSGEGVRIHLCEAPSERVQGSGFRELVPEP